MVIAKLDVLPAGCFIEMDVTYKQGYVRFRANLADGSKSIWSGLFRIAEEPIYLRWSAFWDPE